VPPTTALRWIKLMTDNGLFERVADPGDGRRIFIRLSDASAAQMARLLQSVRHSAAAMV
jgi:DNA-binding MarR family transcriptional regulator